jgi:hypothetical protein
LHLRFSGAITGIRGGEGGREEEEEEEEEEKEPCSGSFPAFGLYVLRAITRF